MATVPASRVLPPALKANGLRNLPAIVHGDIAIDTVEEIIDHIEVQYIQYQFGCGISKMVGPKKQDFWPRMNIL